MQRPGIATTAPALVNVSLYIYAGPNTSVMGVSWTTSTTFRRRLHRFYEKESSSSETGGSGLLA